MTLKHIFVFMVSLAFAFSCGKKSGKEEKKNDGPRPMKHQMMGPEMAPPMQPDMKVATKPAVEKPVVKKPTTPAEAVISEMEGKVEVKKADADDYVVATKDMALHAGDQVRVDAEKANAKLRMWDESTVVLGPGAEAVLNAGADLANGSPSITMLTGSSNLMVEPREEDQSVFTVYTPSAVLSVLGTEFDVGVSDAGTVKLGVEEGIVEVSDQEGNKAVEVPKGKQVIIGLDGKPSAPKAYNAEKEDWGKWYESETKVAGDSADTLSKTAVDRIEELKKKVADLEASIAKMEAKTTEEAGKVETAAAKDDTKAYEKEAQPLVNTLTEAEMASKRDRKLEAIMMANAYQLRRLQALVKAGVIKPKAAKLKIMNDLTVKVNPWFDDYQARRYRDAAKRRARTLRWRNMYLRHHPRGRVYAKNHKVRLPKFYSKLPAKKWKPRKNFRPVYMSGVKYHPRKYKGKKRVVKTSFARNRNWYRVRKSPRAMDKKRAKKLERLRKRNLHMKRRRVVVTHVNPEIRKFRRTRRVPGPGSRVIVGPMGRKVLVGPMGRKVLIGPMGGKVLVGPMGRKVLVGPMGRRVVPGRKIRKLPAPRKRRRAMR